MLCPYQIQVGLGKVPCGQCMNCRINRKRQWIGKLILEWCVNRYSTFATFTYSDEHITKNIHYDDILVKSDMQKYHKLLRHHHGKFRYYTVGEYGDQFGRPHYHSLMFSNTINFEDLDVLKSMEEIWGKGHCYFGFVTEKSIDYVGAYNCKKMTTRKDERRNYRPKEFSMSSLRPGIGAPAIPQFIEAYKKVWDIIIQQGDIPPTFKFNGKDWPWDPLIKDSMRLALGIPLAAQLRPVVRDQPWPDEIIDATLVEQKLKRKYHKRK